MEGFSGATKLIWVATDLLVIALFSILFLFTPIGFNPIVGSICIAVFLAYASAFVALKRTIYRGIPVILGTELVFTLFYYILFFHPYVRDLLGLEDYRLSKFLLYTYENGANQGLVLAVVGFVGFHLGGLLTRAAPKVPAYQRESVNRHDLFDKLFAIFFFAVLVLYSASGLQSADISRYADPNAGSTVGDGLYIIIVMLCVLAFSRIVATLANGRHLRLEHWIILVLAVVWMLRILLAGDRNNFLIIALAAGGGAAAFLFRIRWILIIAGTFGALTLYSTVEILRTMPEPTLEGFMDAYELSRSPDPGGSSFGNTTATLRATFEITPDPVPYGYGFYKLIGIAGIIPLIRGYILAGSSAFVATAGPLTFYMIGPDAGWGVGSNILSDIYMDFGLVGVPVLMASVGYFVARVRHAIGSRGATAKLVFMYMILLGTVGEMPRYSYDLPVRMLAWGLLTFVAYEFIFARRTKSINLHPLKTGLRSHRAPSQNAASGSQQQKSE